MMQVCRSTRRTDANFALRQMAYLLMVMLLFVSEDSGAQEKPPTPSLVPSGSSAAAASREPDEADDVEIGLNNTVVVDVDFAAAVDEMTEQLRYLGDANYRVRRTAQARLQSHPHATLEAILAFVQTAEPNLGSEIVNILSGFATHSDLDISRHSRQVLTEISRQPTYAGFLAANTVSLIADIQERQAIKQLILAGAGISNRPARHRMTKGNLSSPKPRVLFVTPAFRRSDERIERIELLSSTEVVEMRAVEVDEKLAEAISQLKGLEGILLEHCSITVDALAKFRSVRQLKYLELLYVDIDDSALDVLKSLPVSVHLRLFGTDISEAGADRLRKGLDSEDILTYGRGGFLGVALGIGTTEVSRIEPFSAAQRGGIRLGDRLTRIGGEEIADFEALRKELAKYKAGEKVEIQLDRRVIDETEELNVEVRLGYDNLRP
ncbi:MAG TPA: hypothetical protein DDW52_21255 [Planctomycetaceae bacterium]|nr:hypothetical protein [Planctomycetaceae bacterium]